MKLKHLARRGSALVITLALLVTLTLMVVGMTMLMRTEQRAATMLDRELASQQFAMLGVLRVISTLRDTIPGTLDNSRYYASMPGLVVGVDNSAATSVVKIGLLYSNGTINVINSTSITVGAPLSMWQTVTSAQMMNINWFDTGMRAPIIPINDFYTISATDSLSSGANLAAIQVGWSYVTVPSDNGTIVIGRVAYWTDDDATRINVNSAWRRTYPPSSGTVVVNTTSVDLRTTGTLGGIELINASTADLIRGYRNPPSLSFHTLEQLKFVGGMSQDAFERNKFYLTNYGTPNFGTVSLGVMTSTITGIGSIQYGGLGTLAGLANYGTYSFTRQSVAPVGSTSFGVYNIGTEAEVDIFGRPRLNFNTLNISGLGATMNPELTTRLSSTASVSAGTLGFTPAGTWTRIFPGTTKDLLSKFPMVEVVGHGGVGAGLVQSLPTVHNGLQLIANMIEFTRGSNTIAVSATLATTGSNAGLPVLNNQLGYLGLKRTPHINEIIANGTASTYWDGSFESYAYYSWRVQVEFFNPYTVTFSNYKLFISVYREATDHLGVPFPNPGTLSGTFTVASIPPGYSTYEVGEKDADSQYNNFSFEPVYCAAIQLKVNQVRLMTENGYLRDYLAPRHSYMAYNPMNINLNLTNADPFIETQYNIDNGTEVASNAVALGKDDPRVSTVWNRTGTGTPNAQNIALTWSNGSKDSSESGVALNHSTFYHKEASLSSLGELGYIHTGIPWRTLRIQPRVNHTSETDSVPDWALLDIFKLTDDNKFITPSVGRININQLINHASPNPAPIRRAPSFAILGDIGGNALIANNNTGSLADAIIAGTTNFTQTGTFGPAALAGAIFEVASITNGATTDAGAEHIARLIAPMITSRSRRFTVWSVGQTIIDVNRNGIYDPGVDIISGESRYQATIERDPIHNIYRILYCRPLNE